MTLSNHPVIPVKEKLPAFWDLSTKVASDLKLGKIADNDKLLQEINVLLDPSFVDQVNNVIPGWKTIASLHQGETALHTVKVFASCLNVPEYELADSQTRYEIEWAILVHDIDKKIPRLDTAHPFRSAAYSAQILAKVGFVPLSNITDDELDAWKTFVLSAQRKDGERMIHDHSFLKEIIEGMYQCWGDDTSATRILKAVLFHQSLPTVEEWTNAVLLTDQELAFALTLNDMKVLGPLLIADSDSWNMFNSKRMSYLRELRMNIEKTCAKIQSGNVPINIS